MCIRDSDNLANTNDDSCTFLDGVCDTCEDGIVVNNDADGDGVCNNDEVFGCTDELACNFNPDATENDFSCNYAEEFYNCDGICLNAVSVQPLLSITVAVNLSTLPDAISSLESSYHNLSNSSIVATLTPSPIFLARSSRKASRSLPNCPDVKEVSKVACVSVATPCKWPKVS